MRRVRTRVPRDAGHDEFFNALVGDDDRLRREAFTLAYHLHWSPSEVMVLPTDERWAYLRLLGEQLEREREALESSGR